MPQYVVKVTPDDDLYVMWSTVVDAPAVWGTRDEIAEHLLRRDEKKPEFAKPEIEDRMARADLYGTSSFQGDYGWDDDCFMYHQSGWFPRSRLTAFLASFDPETQSFNEDLLEPFEDDDER